MRRYRMYDASRGLTLALAAALVGLALWGASRIGVQTTGRFWLSMVIVAGGGFVVALATHVGTWTKGLKLRASTGTLVLAFVPVLICVGWILVASQPGNGWEEGRLASWSNSIGILGVVHSVGLWHGVLAFAFGLMLGFSLDGVPASADETVPAYDGPAEATAPAADEPVTAERRWTARRRRATTPPATPTEETTRTRTPTP